MKNIKEKLSNKFCLKEVLLKFILNNEEYRSLMQEKAKNINPFKD